MQQFHSYSIFRHIWKKDIPRSLVEGHDHMVMMKDPPKKL